MPSGTRPSQSHSTARTRTSAARVRRIGNPSAAEPVYGSGAGPFASAAAMAQSQAAVSGRFDTVLAKIRLRSGRSRAAIARASGRDAAETASSKPLTVKPARRRAITQAS